MVNPEALRRGALRAYELGRVRVALRAAWFLIPLALICAIETGAGEKCLCIGAVLLGISVFLRWRSRRGTEMVTESLIAGSIPLMAGLAVARFAPPCCSEPELIATCAAICLGAGALSGIWLGLRLARGAATLSTWLGSAGIAILSASLGCAGLGFDAMAGAAVGLVLGAVAAVTISKITS